MFRSYTFLTEFLVSYMNSWFHINDNVNYAILSWILIENCCFLEDHFSIFIFWKKFWWKLKFQRNLFFFGEQALKPCRTFYIPIIKLPWPLAPELSVPPSVEHTNEIFYCLGKPLAVIFIPSAFRHREFSRAGWGCLLDSCQKLGRECLACHGRWRARRGTVTELHHPSTPRLWLQLSHHPPALTQTPSLLTFL